MQWTEGSDAMDGKKQCNGWKGAVQAQMLPSCHNATLCSSLQTLPMILKIYAK